MVELEFVSILRIVDSIGIHVRTLEEVDTNRRRLGTIGFGFTATVNGGTIVTITKTTTNVATYKVVPSITQVEVCPRREISTRQSISGTVDDFIAVESHVIDFVVRGESESLGTYFETDSLTARLSVGSTFIIEDPPQGLVTLQHLVGQDGTVHGTEFFFFHGRNLGVAEFVGDVIVRIVTIFRIIFTITIGIVEGSQIVGNAFRVILGTGSRPILDDVWNFSIVASLIIGKEFVHLGTGNLKDLIPLGAGFRSDRGFTFNSQRACPEIVTTIEVGTLAETNGSALQLVIDVDTSNPQGAGKQRSSRTIGRNEVLGTRSRREVPPHVTTRVDTGSNIVDVKPFERGRRRTSGCGLSTLASVASLFRLAHFSLSRSHSARDKQRR